MLNDLLLLSGNDIPFAQAQISIHQPIIKEIAYIGEEVFFTGCELLNFSKEVLSSEDKTNLEKRSNFEVFMSIMKDSNGALRRNKTCAIMVLTLLFPDYRILIKDKCIVFVKDGEDPHLLTDNNFEVFKEILTKMFCLDIKKNNETYNPAGAKAKAIAEKLMKGRQKAAAAKGETQKFSLLSRYVSILAVGEQKDINSLLSYTVYQLFDEFERFELKENHEITFKLKLAGAKDVKEVDNWMKDIHP